MQIESKNASLLGFFAELPLILFKDNANREQNASLLVFFACSAPKHIKRYVESQTITNKIEKKTKFCLLL